MLSKQKMDGKKKKKKIRKAINEIIGIWNYFILKLFLS